MNSQLITQQPNLFNIYKSETWIELLKVLRQPGFTIPSLLFPVMFYLFFGVVFTMGPTMPSYMLATYGTFGVIGPALFSFGLGIAIERGQGWYDLKEVFPMPPSDQIISRVLVSMAFGGAIIITLFLVGALFAEVVLERWQWLALAGTLLIGTLPFCLMGLALGMSLKANVAPAVVNLIYLPMAFLSGLWVPIQFFPDIMQTIALVLPAYHLAQLALHIIDLDQGGSVLVHILVLAAYVVLFAVLSHQAFQREQS